MEQLSMNLFAQLTNVLGESRDITRYYGDGSFDCPFCSYPIIAPNKQCSNPWCTAHPQMSVTEAQKIIDQIKKRKAEDEARKRDYERAMARIAEEKEARYTARQLAIDEAKKRGACLTCLFDNYDRVKYIRHRGECPNKGKGRR